MLGSKRVYVVWNNWKVKECFIFEEANEVYEVIKVMDWRKKEEDEDYEGGRRREKKTIKGLVKRESGGGAVWCWEGDKEWNSCVLKKEVTETVNIANCLLVFQSTLLFMWYSAFCYTFLLFLKSKIEISYHCTYIFCNKDNKEEGICLNMLRAWILGN